MFTEKAQRIIDSAKDYSFCRGVSELDEPSVLAAMAVETEATVLLAECLGMEPERLRAVCPQYPDPMSCPGILPLTEGVHGLLVSARSFAEEVPDRLHPGLIDLRHMVCAVATSRDACAILKVPPMSIDNASAMLSAWYEKDLEAPHLVDLTQRLRGLRAELLAKVFGQDHAVHAFVEGLFNAEVVATADVKRRAPKAVFVFAGPPGVGKTFLAELGASHLDRPFRRFDMSAYSGYQQHEALVGMARSFHGAHAGILTEFVEKNPSAVLLFDEIEKASTRTVHLFLQILDAGTLEDKYNERDVSFRDTIIIFTTNVGRKLYDSPNMSGVHSANARFHRKTILDALENEKDPETRQPFFPAAICSRMATGYPVLFNHLGVNELERVARSELARTAGLLERQYYKRVLFDDLLPLCMVLREGSRVDARTLRSQSETFLKTEIFKFCQLFKTDRLEEALAKVDHVRFCLDGAMQDMDLEVRALFEQHDRPKVLLVADPDLNALYSEFVPEIDWSTASSADDALEVLASQEVDMVLLDIWIGRTATTGSMTLTPFDHVPAAARGLDKGQELLRKIRERMSHVPVYLLSLAEPDETGDAAGTIDEELFLACVRAGGARGMLVSSFLDGLNRDWQDYRDRFAENLVETARRLYRERASERMGQERKVLAFETAPRLDSENREIAIRLRNLRLTRAISSSDAGEVLEDVERPRTRFDDVIGADAAKEELKFFVDYLKNPKRFAAVGLKAQKGVLLHGPPGTGKTLLARAFAGESDVAFVSTSASTFVTGFQGSGTQSIRNLFARARRYAPAIVFIDEIDTIGKTRTGSGREQEDALNALLTEIDGFTSPSPDRPVFVLAATNFDVDQDSANDDDPGSNRSLDPALVRRFSRTILVDLPDQIARLKYLKLRLKDRPACTVTYDTIRFLSERSSGMSIAVLELIIETAARRAVEAGTELTNEILVNALKCHPVSEADLERPTTKFDDVIGADAAKQELRYFVNYLKDPVRFLARGLKPPKGVLLHGPPGTGKTMLARAMAGESNIAVIPTEGTSLKGRYQGEGARRVRRLFARARSRAPAIIFLDEIDAIGKRRISGEPAEELNALLTEMDGFASPTPDRPVFVLAATNFDVIENDCSEDDPLSARTLDPALVRRFARTVFVDLPDPASRRRYLDMRIKDQIGCAVSDETIDHVVQRSAGISLADLELIIETASRRAAEAGIDLTGELLINALESHPIPDDIERPKARFDDVIGAADAKDELQFFIDYLKTPSRFAARGVKPPRGVLLHGPPGTGKTFLARAFAGESNVAFIPATASSFVTMWQGSGPQNIRRLFVRARRRAPAIIFIDEIDAIGKARTGSPSDSPEEKALNALLTEMDGFISPSPDKPVFVLAATNFEIESPGKPDRQRSARKLDDALVRRFSKTIYVGLPDKAARLRYLNAQLRNGQGGKVPDDVIRLIADQSINWSLSELGRVIETATRNAARADQDLSGQVLEEAFLADKAGTRKDKAPAEMQRTARHEAGHTIMYWLSGWWPVYVTIVARGDYGGYMHRREEEVRDRVRVKNEILANIRTLLGGRAAEIAYYGRQDGLSTGAGADLQAAKEEAETLEYYRMIDESDRGATPRVGSTIDRILDQELERTIQILQENRRHLDTVVEELLKNERVSEQGLQRILPRLPEAPAKH